MKDLLRSIIEKSNVDYMEIHIDRRKTNSVVLSNGIIEDISSKISLNGNIRILNKGQWSFVSFNNISDIEKYYKEGLNNAELMATYNSEKRNIKSSEPIVRDFKSTYLINPVSISLEDKYNTVVKYDDILKKFKRLINRKVVYLDRNEEIYFANSEGSLIKQDKIFTGISFSVVAKDGNNIQMAHNSEGAYKGYEIIENLESLVEETGKAAEDMLDAVPIEAGKYTVVLDQKIAGVFAHEAFGHLSEADFIFENPRFMDIMKIGKRFGIDELNIIDEGNIEGEAGLVFVDDEGVPAQKTYLIKNGILNSRLHSRETAYKMGEELTGNARAINSLYQPIVRMTNTYIDNGNTDFNDMISSIDDGIYAVDYIGGQTNLEMFTFSAGRAYRIKNGKITNLLKNVVLTGNVFETLKNIDMIGNDLKLYGGLGGCGKSGQFPLPVSTGAPHLKINNVLIGGV